MNKKWIIFSVFSCASFCAQAQWIWNVNKMEEIRSQVNTFTYAPAYNSLLSQADYTLKKDNFSVVNKKGIAPSGVKNDYVSLSRYWWPNPETTDKMPYIYKDGESNPELNAYDRNTLGDMAASVNTLALAYFYSKDEKYAKKAVEILHTWFVDKKTRMNPHLEYSQFIPGRDNSKGRPEGLIDSYSFVEMLNSVELIKESRNFPKKDYKAMQQWFKEFAIWMQNSVQGKKENAAKNNHAVAFDAQMITYLLFSGDKQGALKLINEFPKKRIEPQIEPDGRQPNELWRTLAYHYSQYNLGFMTDISYTAKSLGIDLLNYKSADGRSILGAVDYLTTFLGKPVESWPYKQISGWEQKQQDVCHILKRITALDPSHDKYKEIYQKYGKTRQNDRSSLYYGAENSLDEFLGFAAKQLIYGAQLTDSVYQASSNKNKITPRSISKDGKLELVSARDWCSGFFPGSLWLAYGQTGQLQLKEQASKYTWMIQQEKNDRSSHDVGFKINSSFGNGFVMTKDSAYSKVMVEAATTLIKRFDEKVGAIRSWDFNRQVWDYPVIIDNMMNLELLFEAAKLTGDDKFYKVADAHARTTMNNHFRADYSSYHVIDYDPSTGKARKKNTHQGYSDDSAWARGQAWALYGFTMSYRYTKNPEYLKLAQGVAKFIFNHPNLPKDLIPYWDYNAPGIPNEPRDVSAAAISASALYELAQYSGQQGANYIKLADRIVSNLSMHYRAKEHGDNGFLLLHSTGHYPHGSEIDVPINYADYYFLEAVSRRKTMDESIRNNSTTHQFSFINKK